MYNTNTYVSNDNSNYINVIPNDITSEKGQGRRVNAYSDIINGYISDGLVLWYDGINNNGNSNHTSNYSVTTWKNLANSSYNGTLKNSPTWYDNYLSFNGTNNWVSIAQMNYSTTTQEVVTQKTSSTGSNEYIVGNQQNMGNGIIYSKNGYVISDYYINGSFRNIDAPYTLNKINSNSVSYDGSSLNTYSSGTIANSLSISGAISAPTGNTLMALGVNPYGSTYDAGTFFKGNIYSVRIYNRALTEEEILHNYNYDKQRFNIE